MRARRCNIFKKKCTHMETAAGDAAGAEDEEAHASVVVRQLLLQQQDTDTLALSRQRVWAVVVSKPSVLYTQALARWETWSAFVRDRSRSAMTLVLAHECMLRLSALAPVSAKTFATYPTGALWRAFVSAREAVLGDLVPEPASDDAIAAFVDASFAAICRLATVSPAPTAGEFCARFADHSGTARAVDDALTGLLRLQLQPASGSWMPLFAPVLLTLLVRMAARDEDFECVLQQMPCAVAHGCKPAATVALLAHGVLSYTSAVDPADRASIAAFHRLGAAIGRVRVFFDPDGIEFPTFPRSATYARFHAYDPCEAVAAPTRPRRAAHVLAFSFAVLCGMWDVCGADRGHSSFCALVRHAATKFTCTSRGFQLECRADAGRVWAAALADLHGAAQRWPLGCLKGALLWGAACTASDETHGALACSAEPALDLGTALASVLRDPRCKESSQKPACMQRVILNTVVGCICHFL
jgi:hypothetical protein